ncbi:MAG: J domain-containing protein [Myxococcaceae bacterium]
MDVHWSAPQVIDVLYFSDRDVKRKLFERVGAARRLLLVTAARHGKAMSAVAGREPFAAIEQELGEVLDQLVVADEGTVEGMWRDPVGDLADALYPDDKKSAYLAASGYLLLQKGAVKAVVKKHSPADDAWFVQEAVARLAPSVPPPDPAKKPGPGRHRKEAAPKTRRAQREPAEDDRPTPPRPRPIATDPWALLGIPRGTPLAEARKAFRALIAQYHPDKVSHLAPEFRELADQRTRQILEAWDTIEAEAGG